MSSNTLRKVISPAAHSHRIPPIFTTATSTGSGHLSRAIASRASLESNEDQDEEQKNSDAIANELKEAFDRLQRQAEEGQATAEIDISTTKLWRAILETETQSLPNVEISGDI